MIKKLFRWACQLVTLFLIYDLARIFWWCIQSHQGTLMTWGTTYVGDALWILYIELFACVLAGYWVLWGHSRRVNIG